MKTALLLLGALPLFAQSDQKSSVRGRIIDDIYAQGTAKARITLSGGGLKGPSVTTSDEHGNFSFPDLTAGRYQMNIERAGYFNPTPQPVQVGSPSVDLGDIVITRIRVISGTAKWNDGEPAAGATVQVLPIVSGKPVYRIGAGGARVTDQGTYRISNLRPGRYVLIASNGDQSSAAFDSVRPRVASPVFYPSSPSAAGSVVIDVRKSPEAADISFKLEEKPGVTVGGTVVPSAGTPLGTRILLELLLDDVPVQAFDLRQVAAGDSFRFLDIPEGSYTIVASTPQLSRGYQAVKVGKEPVTNLRLDAPEPAAAVIKVEMQEPDGRLTFPVPGVAVRGYFPALQQFGFTAVGSGIPATAAGELRATDVAAGGTYSMEFRGIPAGAYVESVTQGKREQHFGPFEFVASADKVNVLLKKDGGTISGSVRGEKGPVPQAFVVLAPKNRRATLRFQTASSDKDGNYQLSAIAPGDYELYAFDRNDEDSYLDDDYLRKYNAHVIAVTVQPNSSLSLQPELTKVAGQ
jgi:hypothetical protein